MYIKIIMNTVSVVFSAILWAGLTLMPSALFAGNNSIRPHLESLGRVNLLSPSEELDLIRQYQSFAERNDKARLRLQEKLVRANLRFIISNAKKYINLGLPLEELIQEASTGLMTALDKFDISRGVRLSTYSKPWIKHAMVRALQNDGKVIRIPVYQHERFAKIRKVRKRLWTELEREPTYAEVSERLDITPAQVEETVTTFRDVGSLDIAVGENDDVLLGDLLESQCEVPEDYLYSIEVREKLMEKLATLPKLQGQCLRLRFGLDDGRPKQYNEVGEILGITRDKAYRQNRKALKRLQDELETQLLSPYVTYFE